MKNRNFISRRSTLKGIGVIGASTLFRARTANADDKPHKSQNAKISPSEISKIIFQKVEQTPFIDTPEHLTEENQRLAAGISRADNEKFFSRKTSPLQKWTLLTPLWLVRYNFTAQPAFSYY